MMYFLKILVAGLIVATSTEASKRSPVLAGLILALPLVSLISLTWMWGEGQSPQRIADVAVQTFWFVLPTLPMFLALGYLLRRGFSYPLSIGICVIGTVALFYLTQTLVERSGLG